MNRFKITDDSSNVNIKKGRPPYNVAIKLRWHVTGFLQPPPPPSFPLIWGASSDNIHLFEESAARFVGSSWFQIFVNFNSRVGIKPVVDFKSVVDIL